MLLKEQEARGDIENRLRSAVDEKWKTFNEVFKGELGGVREVQKVIENTLL